MNTDPQLLADAPDGDMAEIQGRLKAANEAAARYGFEAGRRAVQLTPEEWAAQIWTRPENAARVMDAELCLSIAASLREREGLPPFQPA